MKREATHLANCNRCANRACKGLPGKLDPCGIYISPWSKFKMAELLLDHPQGLHNVLSSMPFKTDLNFKL